MIALGDGTIRYFAVLHSAKSRRNSETEWRAGVLWAHTSTDPAADDAETMSIDMHERMGSRSLNLLSGSVRLSKRG